MSGYPTHRGERTALRERHATRIVARAAAEAALYGLSIMCIHGEHAPDGCRNAGTGCLCQCHDPEVTT